MRKSLIVIILAILVVIAGVYLRARNGATAQAKADTIVRQDQAGTDTKAAVAGLRTFVRTHSGASVGFTLAASYSRAQAAAQATTTTNSNSQIYADAQRICGGKSDSITQAKCNQDYLAKHLTTIPSPTPVVQPKSTDYQYYLTSPLWTPDLAGSLLLGGFLGLLGGLYGFMRRSH